MVAIKGMEMPKNCAECGVRHDCEVSNEWDEFDWNYNERCDGCPLVEIEERKVEKCTDCKEYNQEKHYCPKFCDVIRNTTKEMQEFYKGEHEKLERIEQIINDWKESVEWDIEMHDTLEEIIKVLEQE